MSPKSIFSILIVMLILSLGFKVSAQIQSSSFITTWNTNPKGSWLLDTTSVTLPTVEGFIYNYDVDWENDGVFDEFGITGPVSHDFEVPGVYSIAIKGFFPTLSFSWHKDREKIISIDNWGDIQWMTMKEAFKDAINLEYNASDAPDLSYVTDMSWMFYRAESFNGDLSNWDVSNVTDLALMFCKASSFNGDISTWDVSSVTNIGSMFEEANNFNQDLSQWDVSNVTNMRGVFEGASSFNSDLSQWNVSNVNNTISMFNGASSFNSDLSQWNVSNVQYAYSMFSHASSFSSDLSQWDVSKIERIYSMFLGATSFNSDLNSWDVSKVTNFSQVFQLASSFNGNVSNWDLSNATTTEFMFCEASSFNQDLSQWDVSNVTRMGYMFDRAFAFDQDLGSWSMEKLIWASHFLSFSGISAENYDNSLNAWSEQSVLNDLEFGANNLEYCNGIDARQKLIDEHNWTFIGDDYGCSTGQEMDIISYDKFYKIYPNPSKGICAIYFNQLQNNLNISIIDLKGLKLYGEQFTGIKFTKDLPPGIYFIEMIKFDKKEVQKLIVL